MEMPSSLSSVTEWLATPTFYSSSILTGAGVQSASSNSLTASSMKFGRPLTCRCPWDSPLYTLRTASTRPRYYLVSKYLRSSSFFFKPCKPNRTLFPYYLLLLWASHSSGFLSYGLDGGPQQDLSLSHYLLIKTIDYDREQTGSEEEYLK